MLQGRGKLLAVTALSVAVLALGLGVLSSRAQSEQTLAQQAVQCDPAQAIFLTRRGQLPISVEVADDPAERAQGLMFRQSLAQQHGMLFIYEQPQLASFWMRNTLIPLDIIFMDSSGTVRHIHPNARPLDETPIPGASVGDPNPLRLMVLEIAGGEAERLGILTGQAMAYPAINPDLAAISCD